MSTLLFHAGNEEAVQIVALRQELDERAFMTRDGQPLRRIFDVKFRMVLQKVSHNAAVFLIIHGTSAVDQDAARADALRGAVQDAPLQGRQGLQIAGILAPAQVDFVAQDAEARTRRIDQDPVGFAGIFLADGAAVLEQGPHILETQLLGIVFDEPQLMFVDIAAVDDARRAAQGSQMGRLAAGSSADVEDDFVRLGIDDMGDQLGRFILDDSPAIAEAGQLVDARIAIEIDAIRRNGSRTGRLALLFQLSQQVFATGDGRIDAQAQCRDGIEILAEPFCIVWAIFFQPAADKPALLMIRQGQIGCQVFVLIGNDELVPPADTVAQHGIDELGHAFIAEFRRHLDSFVAGCRFGDFGHAENLIQAQADNGQADGIELFQLARTDLGNDPVQVIEAAQGPVNEFCIKTPVPVGKLMLLYRLRDDDIAIPFVPADSQQALKGNFTYVHRFLPISKSTGEQHKSRATVFFAAVVPLLCMESCL